MGFYENLITDKELLDFSQNFGVQRNYIGSRLFPDRKSQHVKQEFMRLIGSGTLPIAAHIAAYDTEAHIASRVPFEHIDIDALIIKEKINLSEELQRVTGGMKMDGVKKYVFDDIARMAEAVVTRAEAAKMEVISSGEMKIKDNGLNSTIDFRVPAEAKTSATWSADTNVLSELRKMQDAAEDRCGIAPNEIVTSRAIFNAICTNKSIQTAIFGTVGTGTLPSLAQVNALLATHFNGLQISVNEAKYQEISTVGGETKRTAKRFFPKDKLVMASTQNGACGAGIWGVTPEERNQSATWDQKRMEQFVTVVQWHTDDPVAVWTKAAGLFIPALNNPEGMGIATITVSEG